jgi:hypothetical protein
MSDLDPFCQRVVRLSITPAHRNRITGSLFALLLLGLGLMASARPAYADAPTFADRIKFGSGRDPIKTIAFGDMNGDGSLDLVVGNDGAQNLVYLNDGLGNYYDGSVGSCDAAPADVRCFGSGEDRTTSVTVADINGDGRLDIVAGLRSGQSRVHLNDKNGRFTDSRDFGPERGNMLSVAVGDVNGDAAPDIVTGGETQGVVYLNDGQGGFYRGPVDNCASPQAAFRCFGAGRTDAVALADVDGDGTLDVIAGSNLSAKEGTQSAIYLNDGAAGFATAGSSDCGLPVNKNVMRCFGSSDAAAVIERVAAGDLDGDGRPDLVLAYRGGANAAYLNTGQGMFSSENSFDVQVAPTRNTVLEDLAAETGASSAASADLADRSLTLADVNADGALDVIAGTSQQGSYVYLNDGAGRFHFDPTHVIPFGTGTEAIAVVAAGDVDFDGDLDLAVGNSSQRSEVYLNDGAGTFPPGDPFGSSITGAVAVGDLNGDGRLDVIAAENNIGVKIYLGSGEGRLDTQHPLLVSKDNPVSLAAADVNDDRKLDVIIGYSNGPAAVYLNDGKANFPDKPSSHFGDNNVRALATGDMDGNGSLDIVAGPPPNGGLNTVYLNDGQGNFGWQGGERKVSNTGHHTRSLAVGDLNGDGALDIVAGNVGGYFQGEPNYVYLNDRTGHFDGGDSEHQLAGDAGNTTSVALGDVNGDGYLDIVAGNKGYQSTQDFVYLNDGSGAFPLSRRLGSGQGTTALALADMNGDGALDIIAAHPSERDPISGQILSRNAVYINTGMGNFPIVRDFITGRGGAAVTVAVGDLDGDGLQDIVTGGNNQSSMVTLNRSRRGSGQADVLKLAALTRPDGAPDAAHYASPVILQDQRIPITYTLYGPATTPVGHVELEYSKDGGGRWLRAVPTTDTLTTTLAAAPFPSTTLTNTHVYTWDTFASGFFDQSDNVVLRLRAYPGTGVAPNGVADTQQWPYAVASTSPVRVRGTQVRVFDETKAISSTVAGALVYRLPADQDVGAEPLGSAPGVPFLTNARGYLQGAGELAVGDRLVAMLPVGGGDGVTVYQTSAQPLPTGMAAYTVTSPGTQELVVSKDHPLLLFDLDVSLEWDARNDGTFLDDLEESLKRSSEVLYNVSNGQMALGEVRIHQNKENWLGADVVVFANSGIRPMSSMGGMVGHPTNDIGASGVITDAYLPGQIHMGPLWDPYGQSRAELTLDWQRALAHEFGHYFLFLPDNYLGYAEDGSVMSVDCAGSFMTSAYEADYSKFLNAAQWQGDCLKTIAAHLTGRPDWKTLKQFYPMIQEGTGRPGPAVLPLNVTRVVRIEPADPVTALPARNLDLRDALTNERLTVKQGQGYLIKTQGTADLHDDTLIALGPTGKSDRIKVRGAESKRGAGPSDRICVLDSGSEPPLAGCLDDVTALSGAVRLRAVPGWRPNIIVRPIEVPTGSTVITRTESISTMEKLTTTRVVSETATLFKPALAVTVTLPAAAAAPGVLNAQVYSTHSAPDSYWPTYSPTARLQPSRSTGQLAFSQVITLEYPIFTGSVRVWTGAQGREAVDEFYVTPDCGLEASGAWCPESYTGDQATGRPGTAVDYQLTMGTNDRPGSATNNRPSMGANDIPGSSTNNRPGMATNDRPGSSTNNRPGMAVDYRSGMETNNRPGMGTNNRPGMGTNNRPGMAANVRGWGANRRALGAPIASSDGQVSIFNVKDILGDTGTDSLQALATVPNLPDWLTPVGKGYRFVASKPLNRTIDFNYLQREVPEGYEQDLQLYFSPNEGGTWTRLNTRLDVNENEATAPAEQSGIYVLAASLDIPLVATGWSLFGYPVPETRPVSEALRSIAGHYTTVVGFDPEDAGDPWKIYDLAAPAFANDLRELRYGNGYWINVSEPITLQLKVVSEVNPAAPSLPQNGKQGTLNQRTPPALFFGSVQGDPAAQSPVGSNVIATIDGAQCGQGRTLRGPNGSLLYTVKVSSSAEIAGCGAPGREVAFQVGSQKMTTTALWDNGRPKALDLN